MAQWPRVTFSAAMLIFQIILMILWGLFGEYEEAGSGMIAKYYPVFQDVHVMIFVGFGFLMCFLESYSYSSVAYNMLISAVVLQWACFMNQWIPTSIEGHFSADVKITLQTMIAADFTCGAVLITFGAVLGKVTRLQLLIIGLIECIFFAINEAILVKKLYIADVGGSIVIHAFGAYFGIVVSWIMNTKPRTENIRESKTSNMFAMIGTVFLWMYWPSFNGAMLGDKPAEQNRAFINTYISLAASCVSAFTLSGMINKKQRQYMDQIQNATFAGGVAIGACANLAMTPLGACVVGFIGGIVSCAGYAVLTPCLERTMKLHDTCGVHNAHGMTGVLSAICAAVAAAAIPDSAYGMGELTSIYEKRNERTASEQAGYQAAALFVGLALAIMGGVVAGLMAKWIDPQSPEEDFIDDKSWEVPEGVMDVKPIENGIELQANGHPHV